MEKEDDEDMEIERERKIREKRNESVKRVVSLLIDFEKEFEVVEWGDGEGTDIIIKETEYNQVTNQFEKYTQKISINNNGFLTFERQEEIKEKKDDTKL